jgi:peptide/nickel transport system substrate-binding protein
MFSERSIKGVSRTLIVAAVIVIVIIAGIGAYYLTRPAPTEVGQTLIVATSTDVMNVDPAHAIIFTDRFVLNLVFDNLLELKPPGFVEFDGQLATEWNASEDGMKWDFTLRQGVKFHDGTEMTANDVKFCIDRFIETGGPAIVFYSDLDHVEVLGTHKVRVYMKTPNAYIQRVFAMSLCGGIYPKKACEEAGDDWGSKVLIGSGPFKFVEWVQGERVVLERNDDYWGMKPKLEKITLLLDMDPTVGRMSLERGDIDVFQETILHADIPALKENPDIEWQGQPTGHTRFLCFNQNMTILQDVRVRQAICYGINVTRVFELGFHGDGKATYSLVNIRDPIFYKPSYEKYECDPDKAKDLLVEAGYPDGFEITLLITDHFETSDTDAAVVIKDDLAKIGIDVTIDFEEWATFVEKAPSAPVYMSGWLTGSFDPEENLMLVVHGEYGYLRRNLHYNNTELNELGYLGKAETDINEREKIYDDAQDIMADDAPLYPLKHTIRYIFYQQWVKGLEFSPILDGDDVMWVDVYLGARD